MYYIPISKATFHKTPPAALAWLPAAPLHIFCTFPAERSSPEHSPLSGQPGQAAAWADCTVKIGHTSQL